MHKGFLLRRALACAVVFAVVSPAVAGDDAVRPADPPPYPANRVDDPARTGGGLLWASRSPVGSRTPRIERTFDDPGAAAYGAPESAVHEVMYVQVLHTPIAISPWNRYDESGFKRIEEARQSWLRQRGYIESVRTHVNPRYIDGASAATTAKAPRPRAIFRKPPEVKATAPLRAAADDCCEGAPVVRVRRVVGADADAP